MQRHTAFIVQACRTVTWSILISAELISNHELIKSIKGICLHCTFLQYYKTREDSLLRDRPPLSIKLKSNFICHASGYKLFQ